MAKVMFLSLSVALSVRQSVCLLATLRENDWTDFHEFFQSRWDLIQGTIGSIFRLFHSTPWIQEFFHTYSEESMTLSSIAEKRLNGFSWNFQKTMDLTQGTLWNTFGMLRLTPCIMGRFIYFLDPCMFVILWKTGEWIFMIFLWNVRHDTRNN